MSSQPSTPSAPPADGEEDDSRLHISSITEMPSGHDAELATIFREMRRASGVSVEQMAGRLATRGETIEALESGALLALPEWGELTRIVNAYAKQLNLDSRPILRRLEGQLGANKPAVATPPPALAESALSAPEPAARVSSNSSGPPMPPSATPPDQTPARPPEPSPKARKSPLPRPPGATAPPRPPAPPLPHAVTSASAAAPEREEKPNGRVVLFARSLLQWAVLIGFVISLGLGMWYAAKNPRMVWSTLDALPQPIPRVMRSAWNFMRPLETTPARPQISDPDNRKSDKLP